MFRKLNIQLVVINLALTSLVLLSVFIAINVYMNKIVEKMPLASRNFPSGILNRFNGGAQNAQNLINAISKKNGFAFLDSLKTISLTTGIISILLAIMISFVLANKALRPVREAWEKQQMFIADASHELRTPLAVLSTNLDAVLDSPEEKVSEQSEWLGNMKNEIDRMSKLVNDLLFLSRMDAKSDALKPEAFLLSDLADKVVGSFHAVAAERSLTLKPDIQAGVTINGIESRIHQLIVILVDNAMKNTLSNGKITVSLSTSHNRAALDISDTGVGISEQHLPHIFDRFYRTDAARTSEEGGSGLGLAIARQIVREHKGEITVQSKVGVGTTFTVMLPI